MIGTPAVPRDCLDSTDRHQCAPDKLNSLSVRVLASVEPRTDQHEIAVLVGSRDLGARFHSGGKRGHIVRPDGTSQPNGSDAATDWPEGT